MAPIRTGFVGLSKSGWASYATGPSLLKTGKYTINAVSTRSAESAEASAKKQTEAQAAAGVKVKAYHGSTEAIANDPDLDLIVVAVKVPDHLEATLPVINARKNLFIEYPAGVSIEQTEHLANLAREKGIRSVVGLQGRQSPIVNKVKEFIESGKIGKILSTSIIALSPKELGLWGGTIKDVYADLTTDPSLGASLLDIGVAHQLDAVLFALGLQFRSVSSISTILYPTTTVVNEQLEPIGKEIPNRTEDHLAFSGLLSNGALASVVWRAGEPSTPGRKQFIWVIDGTEGSIKVESDDVNSAMIHNEDPDLFLNGEKIEVEGKGRFTVNIANVFEEFAKGDEGQHATLEDTVKLKRLLDAIGTSAKEGRNITL